jgi:hypothetical protein
LAPAWRGAWLGVAWLVNQEAVAIVSIATASPGRRKPFTQDQKETQA